MPTLVINGNKCKTKGNQLGSGGQSSVFRIVLNDTEVAIKIIKKDSSSDSVSRFENEIEHCKELNNEHVINIIDSGTLLYGEEAAEDVRLYYTMPIYKKSLRDILRDTNRLTIATAFSYIMQLCDAIKYIHSMGIYHRDVKPENILLDDDRLILTDFGIAHFKNSELTTPQKWLGNKEYSAPEQKRKGNATNVGKEADIFALGCIMNELFTGSIPSGTSYIQVADIHPFLADIDTLIENCLRQDPNERPSIELVASQVKSIHYNYSKSKDDLIFDLSEDSNMCDEILSRKLIDAIIDRAADDILTAKIIYETKSDEQLEEYEINYNCDIHYSIDEKLAKHFFSTLVSQKCLDKFNSEGDGDPKRLHYKSLDVNSESGKEILNSFLSAIDKKGMVSVLKRT